MSTTALVHSLVHILRPARPQAALVTLTLHRQPNYLRSPSRNVAICLRTSSATTIGNCSIRTSSRTCTETDVGDDGGGGRGDAPPRKRKRKESCEDDFTLFDLDDENREHQKFDGSVAKNGRVL
uniref:Uncharacterized protein n=1 Tax=Globodera rostochiensis TaxID=31243 RepID=A0A914I484_GLORO